METGKILNIEHRELDITPTPSILQLLENLSVEPWSCVAELIDNSLDDFRRSAKVDGKVSVNYDNEELIIEDNGSGMSLDELEKAMRAGYSSKSKAGELGLFGVGFNVACARLGRKATVLTKRVQDNHWTQVIVDINDLRRKNSFLIKPVSVDRKSQYDSGTIIIISLHKEHSSNFSRPKYMKTVADELGKAYSYILRSSVPGLTGEVSGAIRSVSIEVGSNQVKPWLPCIWSETRSVTYNKNPINAVQKFERHLPDALICEDCGHWHSDHKALKCEACDSTNLKVTSRRIWGWIGVQRYMDRLEFGINFIRNGRTIVFRDQSIFTFFDTSTGETWKDYPVEWPADMGRIVGEVHCDHVRVDFIKQNFDKDDPNWRGVIDVVRGRTSLQPKRAHGIHNDSPLSTIFNAYRINEPGTRYLVPGNGTKAIHDATKNWALKFYDGDTEFQSDEKWYLAAQNHEKQAASTPTNTPTTQNPIGGNSSPVNPTSPNGSAKPAATPINSTPKETLKQKAERYEKGGVKRDDLSKTVTPASIAKMYHLICWETYSEIKDENGVLLPVMAIPESGNTIKVYAYKQANVFTKYGRNTSDLLIMEAAQQIKILNGSATPLSQIYAEILTNFPDEEKSQVTLRSRIHEMETRLQTRLAPLASMQPNEFWDSLSDTVKDLAEANSVASGQSIIWSNAINSGYFASFIPLIGLKDLLLNIPEKLFDGNLFRQHFATAHAAAARERARDYIVRAIEDLHRIKEIKGHLNNYELQMADAALSFLNDSIQYE